MGIICILAFWWLNKKKIWKDSRESRSKFKSDSNGNVRNERWKNMFKKFLSTEEYFFFFLNILKVAIDDRKRKFLKEDPRGSIIVMRVFRGSCTLPDSSCLWFVRSMGRCEWGTHFSTHASLEFFSLASIQKVSFSVVQSSLHDLRSRLYSNNNSTRIRMNISKISTYWLKKKKDQKSNKF